MFRFIKQYLERRRFNKFLKVVAIRSAQMSGGWKDAEDALKDFKISHSKFLERANRKPHEVRLDEMIKSTIDDIPKKG